MNAEIPKRPADFTGADKLLDTFSYTRELVTHEHAVAKVAVEALREIMDQRYNSAAWLRGRAGRAIVKIVDSGWTP